MHESGIVQNILEIAIEAASEQNAHSIKKIHIQVGKMNAVDPNALAFAFEILKENTKAAEATLVVDEIPITVECSDCLAVFEADDFNIICPNCNSTNTNIITGNELDVLDLEVE